jgi:hypothetical protein
MSVCLVIDQSSKELGKHLQTPTLIGCMLLMIQFKSAASQPPPRLLHFDQRSLKLYHAFCAFIRKLETNLLIKTPHREMGRFAVRA